MPSPMKWAIAIAIGLGIVVTGWRLANSAWFSWVLPAFFVLNCLVLIIVVLLQSGKAADLAGAFGGAGSQTAFGPRGAANVLSRATTWCAIMFMVCALALVLQKDKAASTGTSVLEKVSKPAPPATPPPAQQPAPTNPSGPASSQGGGSKNPPPTPPATKP
jgi:preprotein translocase subunit SecG